jgi:multicomponent Na+:H+ antiporter subunit B
VSPRARKAIFFLAAVGIAWLFGSAVFALPPSGAYPGPYGDLVNAHSVSDRHLANAVAAVTFDFRGLDTLGEELVFFTAVMGVRLLLRPTEKEHLAPPSSHRRDRTPIAPTEAIGAASGLLMPLSLLVGLEVTAHGHLTPGGGFQAGAMVGSFVALLYLADRYPLFRKVASPEVMDPLKAAAVVGFVCVGLAGLVSGAFLLNVLPKGTFGQLASGGVLPYLNAFVTVEVAAGIAVILYELLTQVLSVRQKEEAGE